MTERRLETLFAAAAARIERLEPAAACAAVETGGVLIDIRSRDSRELSGVVPGSLHVPRTVLEWRLEPDGAWRSPHAPPTDARVLVLCDGGCASVFAAAQLAALGYERAGDVIGGFAAWCEAGLPWRAGTDAPLAPGELPGMRPPE